MFLLLFLLIFVIILLLGILLYYYFTPTPNSSTKTAEPPSSILKPSNTPPPIYNIPIEVGLDNERILHSRCDDIHGCASTLVCDLQTKRCRLPLLGPCATDKDCVTGHHCVDWVCQQKPVYEEIPTQKEISSSSKHVRFQYL